MFVGDDMLDAWTADGRPAGKQPRRVIGALGLSTQPPSVPSMPGLDSVIAPPSMGPQGSEGAPAVPGGVAPPQPIPQRPPLPTSDDAGPTAHSPKQGSPVGTGGDSSPVADSAPKPKQFTSDELRRMGAAGSLNASLSAVEGAKEAGRKAAEIEAEESRAYAEEHEATRQRQEALDREREARARADFQALESKRLAVSDLIEKRANTKIDRKADHPILGAIAVALGAIGSAMSGRKDGGNPALDALMASIDRKVAGQMADLDNMDKTIGNKRQEIDDFRTHVSDRNAMFSAFSAAEERRTALRLREIGARSNVDKVRAETEKMAAMLDERAAAHVGEAVDKQYARDQSEAERKQRALEHRQSLGVQYAQLGQRKAEHKDEMAFKREQADKDRMAAIDAARAQGDGARAKEFGELEKINRETGVSDVKTGERILQPEGQKMMDEAAKLEEKAKAFREKGQLNIGAQAQANMLEQKAKQLRGEAQLRHQFRARNDKEAIEVGQMIGSTQGAISEIDDLKDLAKKHGKAWIGTDEGQKAIKAKLGVLTFTLKDAFQGGSYDAGLKAALQEMTGGDPTKVDVNTFTSWLGNSDSPDGALDALANSLESRVQNRLKVAGDGYKGVWKATRKIPPKPTEADKAASGVVQGRTTEEARAAVQPASWLREPTGKIGAKVQAIKEADAESTGSSTRIGFSRSQEQHINLLLKAREKGGDAAKQANTKLLDLTKSKIPSVQLHSLNLLRLEAPELYEQGLANVPPAIRKEHEDFVSIRAGVNKGR